MWGFMIAALGRARRGPCRLARCAAAMSRRPRSTGVSKAGGAKTGKAGQAAKGRQQALAAPSQPVPSDRPVRVYADGIYDLFHYGHMRQLQQCKQLFPNTHLLVGVCNDALTHKCKGKTVMTEFERYESVRHCRWVDEVVENAPWVVDTAFLEKHNIDFVAHDDLPYPDVTGSADDAYGFVKRIGKFRATQRTNGISTSDLILRLIKDYNDYVLRNLGRGYTRQDMNVSYVREKRLRMRSKLQTLGTKVREQQQRVEQKVRRFWAEHHGRELSDFADRFTERFLRVVGGRRRRGENADSGSGSPSCSSE